MEENELINDRCPESRYLFTLAHAPESIDKKLKLDLENHLKYCDFCSEEFSLLMSNLKKQVTDLRMHLLSEKTELKSLMTEIESSEILKDKIADLVARFPQPEPRGFNIAKIESWLKKLKSAGSDLKQFFDIIPLNIPVMSSAAVRAVSESMLHDEKIFRELMSDANDLMRNGEYAAAAETYSKVCSIVKETSLEKSIHLLTGIAYLKSGIFDRAKDYLEDCTGKEAGQEAYWFLSYALFETGDFEGAFKSLQIVEGLHGELGDKAKNLLNDMM